MSEDPITIWIDRLKQRDSRATEVIWHEYFQRLVYLARDRLGTMPRRTDDEEDIALSAMHSFIRGAQNERFPRLNDRSDLWRLLVTIAARKVSHRNRKHFTAKRGGGVVRGESVFGNRNDRGAIADVLGSDPTPEFVAETTDTCRRLIATLEDETLQQIVFMKLEGLSNSEIATDLECATRTVERKLEKIRSIWNATIPD